MSNRAIQLIDWSQPVNWAHPLNRGLVSWWMAVPGRAGFGSATWRDLCGRNHGTLSGMDAASDWIADATGGRWGHLNFAGTDTQSVQITSSTSIMSGQPQYTLLSLFRTSSRYGSNQILHGERRASGDAWIVKLNIGATDQAPGVNWPNGLTAGSLELAVQQNDGTYRLVGETYGVNLVDGEWHVGAGVRDGNNAYVYYTSGGQIHSIGPVDISAISYTNSTSTPSYNIARDLSDNVGYFNGDQAAAWIYHKAFSFDDFKAFNDQVNNFYPGLLRRISTIKYFVPATGAFTLTADSATYTVTGTDASLEQGYSVAADSAPYSVTGTDASLEQGYAIAADGATYTVTGTDATLLQGYVVTADAASYAVSGTDVTLTVGAGGTFTLTADAATYTVTGTDASLFHGYVLTAYNTASAGFVAASSQYYTGTTIAFGTSDFAFACWIYLNNTTGVKTIVSLGSVTNDIEHLWLTVSGTSLFLSLNDSVQATRLTWTFGAGFSTGWNHIVVNFDRSGNATCWINGSAPTAPTVDISGHAAALNPTTFYVGRKVAGSDYFDGRIDKLIYTNAILDSSEIAELSAGAKLSNFSSGLSAKTVYGWEMEAVDGGTQTSSFTSNDLVPTNTPTQEEGYSTGKGSLFAITGTDASLEQGYAIAADGASYTVTGTNITVEWNRVLSAGSATFTVSGTDVTLNYSGSVGFSLTAEGTQIVLNASNATLTYSALLNEFPELDFSTDYLIMDFPESVTYISKSQYGDTRYTVAKAIQAQPSHQERATSGGTYAGYDLTWLLPGVLMNTTPKISDVILDDAGTEWTIINAQYDQMDRMWNMQTVNLVLFFDLRDQIWLYKPDTASTLVDAAGRYTPTFTPAATLIPARIQEQRGDFSEERGKRGTQRTYQIFILEPITDITTEWYAQDTSGNKYDITGWTNKATITDLMTLEAVKRA